MKIKIISIASKKTEYESIISDYLRRLPPKITSEHIRIPIVKRTKKQSINQIIDIESNKFLERIDDKETLIVLDQSGRSVSTNEFSNWMQDWLDNSIDPIFGIGGPDGFSESVLNRANKILSLSSMTLPHSLVPVILAEQLYRSWSILNNLPYHRS
tara:strand:- start:206 stop:673 length:468 start_codon:yes stop_codon:yes gene_type:complete